MKQNGFALVLVFVLMSTVLTIVALTLYQTALCRSLARLQCVHYQQQYALSGLRSYALDYTRRRWRTIIASQTPTSREMLKWCTINDVPYTARMMWEKTAPDRLKITVNLQASGVALQAQTTMRASSDKTFVAVLDDAHLSTERAWESS